MAKRRGVKKRTNVPKPSRHSRKAKVLREPMDYNRTLFTASIITFLAIVFLLVAFNNTGNYTGNAVAQITGNAVDASGAGSVSGDWFSLLGSPTLSSIFLYLFGPPVSLEQIGAASSVIITLAIWLLFFFTFSDIIGTFSSFGWGKNKKWISWVIGFLISVIAANIQTVVLFASWFTKIFAFAGTIAVYVSLGAALVAFVGVNLGLNFLNKWILRRRAMMMAASAAAGGEKLAGGIEGLSKITKKLEKFGEE